MFNPDYVYDRLFDFASHKGTTVKAYGATFMIDGFCEVVSIRDCEDITFEGGRFDHKRKPIPNSLMKRK